MAKPKRVLIIGGGPAGLTAGYELLKKGRERFQVDVLEADPVYVGGIARTAEYKGYRFDIGGHRFLTKSEEIEALWVEMLGEEMPVRERMSRIFYRRRFFHYPLKPLNALANLGPLTSARVLASYAKARLWPIEPETSLADWVTNRFGNRLFQVFFKSYTEKVWGISCDDISADWAAQRIKGLSLTGAVRDALLGERRDDGEVVKTLVSTFAYPRLGPGMVWEAARDRIEEWGGRVHLDRRVVQVRRWGSRLEVLARGTDGTEQRFRVDHVISSMPLRELITSLPKVPEEVRAAASSLTYRAFFTVVLIVDDPDLFPDNWIYVHDPDVRVGRLQNFKTWSPAMVPDPSRTCLGMEYFCDEGDALWTSPDDELVALGSKEIDQLGLARSADVVDGTVVRMPKAYPVYDDHYAEHTGTIRRWLEAELPGIQVVGRAGMHRYNNQDHSMMTALLAARNLMGESWDPWKVNIDAEYHEEKTGPDSSGWLAP